MSSMRHHTLLTTGKHTWANQMPNSTTKSDKFRDQLKHLLYKNIINIKNMLNVTWTLENYETTSLKFLSKFATNVVNFFFKNLLFGQQDSGTIKRCQWLHNEDSVETSSNCIYFVRKCAGEQWRYVNDALQGLSFDPPPPTFNHKIFTWIPVLVGSTILIKWHC